MHSRLGVQKGQRQFWGMTWKIHLNLPKTNSVKVVARTTQSWSWNIYFLKPYVLCEYKEKEKTMLFVVIWSSNCKLPSIIVTNISRSSPHTTFWFIEVRNQHLKTNFKVCSLMCTSWSSVNQISNVKFSAYFRVLFALWSLKYPHPKSQQTPRVFAEFEMAVNLSYSFISFQKHDKKVSIAQFKTRGSALKIS